MARRYHHLSLRGGARSGRAASRAFTGSAASSVPTPDPVAPIVNNQQFFIIDPNAAEGTLVGTVQFANSPSPAAPVTFDSPPAAFSLNPTTRRITVANSAALAALDGTTPIYNITAANSAGSDGAAISIEVGTTSLVFVQSFVLAEFAGASSPGYFRVPIWFKKGDVPSGSSIVCQIGGVDIDHAQYDNRCYWSDGSLKGAIMRANFGTFTALQEKTVSVYKLAGGSFNNTTAATVADISDEIQCAFSSLTEYNGTTTVTRGAGAALADFQTHAAVATRVTRFAGGPVCDGFKVWGMAKDGADGSGAADAHLKANWYVERWKDENGDEVDVEYAAVVAQDWWSIAAKYRLNYTLALKLGASTIETYSGLQHPYRSRMRTVDQVNDAGHGRRNWKTARPTLFYKPDQAYWISAGIAPAYDQDLALTSAADRGWQNTYVPFGNMSHRAGMAASGGYQGRGIWPSFDVVAFGRQTADDLRAARANAHAGMHVPYNFASNNNRTRTAESADVANTVISLILDPKSSGEYTFSGLPAPVHAYNRSGTNALYKDGYVDPLGGSGVWSQLENSNAHTPNFCEFMYLIEGDEEWLDQLLSAAVGSINKQLGNEFGGRAQAHGYRETAYRSAFSIPATYWGGITLYHSQPRSMAWGTNLLGAAAAWVPEDHEAGPYIRKLNEHNGDFIGQSITTPYLPQSSLDAGLVSIGSGVIAPWEIHFQTICACRNFIITEDPGFEAWAEVLANHAAGAPSRGEFYNNTYRGMVRPKAGTWAASTNEFFAAGLRRFAVGGSVDSATNRVTLSLGGNSGAWSLTLTAGDDFYWSTTGIDTSFSPLTLPAEVTDGTVYYLGDIVGSTARVYRDAALTDLVVFASSVSTVVLGLRLQTQDDYPIAASPPGIPSSDNEIMQGYAALVMAHRAGFAVATQDLVDDYYAFVEPIARNTTPAWALKD